MTLESVREAGKIRRNEKLPSRTFDYDVKPQPYAIKEPTPKLPDPCPHDLEAS